jgi:hypothetical protein
LTTDKLGAAGATSTATDAVGAGVGSVPEAGVPVGVAVLSISAKAGPDWLAKSASVSAETPKPLRHRIVRLAPDREDLVCMKYSIIMTRILNFHLIFQHLNSVQDRSLSCGGLGQR